MNTNEPSGNPGAEGTLGSASRSVNDLASMATHQIGDTVNRSKEKLAEMQALVSERTRECARNTDRYVHENPWQVVGLAAGIGLVVGLLMRR